jgi:hypothetical protein
VTLAWPAAELADLGLEIRQRDRKADIEKWRPIFKAANIKRK